MSEMQLRRVIEIVEASGAYLLVDETYRDMVFGPKPPLAAALSRRAISVSCVSKAYGLPGLRVGWLICRDHELQETLLAAKEQICICNSVLTEELAFRFLRDRESRAPSIRQHIECNRAIMRGWMDTEPHLEWVEPQGGVVCFPRIVARQAVDIDRFYRVLRDTYRVAVGPGYWFEVDSRHMRLGFGYPSASDLDAGLRSVSAALDATSTA